MPASIDLPLLRKAIRAGSPALLKKVLGKLDPQTLAQNLPDLPPAELKIVTKCLLQERRFMVAISALPEEFLSQLLERFDDPLMATILETLETNEAKYLAEQLGPERLHAVLSLANPQTQSSISRLLHYSPDSAAGRMNPNFVAVSPTTTVKVAIQRIRTAPRDAPLFYLYVVENETLVGVVSLGQLVRTPDETPLRELMETNLVTVHPEADQEHVARTISRFNLLAVPVVEPSGQIIGVVTIDDVIDVLEEEATEDMYNMAGLQEGDRVFSPPHRSLIKRLPWNALNLCTSLGAALVVSLFEGTISQLVVLATFMPIVAGIGGNTGNQTLTVILRGITLGELEFSSALRALVKEISVGIGIGIVLGVSVGIISYLWKGNAMLGVVIMLAMLSNLFVAAFVGTAIPLTLKRLKLDPALGASILVTMCTDIFGFFSFLGLATLLMK